MIYNENIIIWIGIFLVSTWILYTFNLRQTWQKERQNKGLVNHREANPPRFYSRYIFSNKKYLTKCFRLIIAAIVMSLIIFIGCVILAPVNDFKGNVLQILKTLLCIVLVYLFLCDAIKKEDFHDTSDLEKINKVNWIKKVYDRMKLFFINPIVDDEYEESRIYIENKIEQWIKKNEERAIPSKIAQKKKIKATEIEIFICDIQRFISRNVDLANQDEGLVEEYYDLVFDLYERYRKGNTTNLFNDIADIIYNVILYGFHIPIVTLIEYLDRLTVGNKMYIEVIEQMNSEIDVNRTNNRRVDTVSSNDLQNMIGDISRNNNTSDIGLA